jgi:hypothetical protein
MSETLTQPARRAMALASEEARKFNHGYVGTEHVLLGLLTEPTCGAVATLQRLGITLAQMRSEIEKLAPRGPAVVQKHEVPLTPRAKHVMTLATQIATSLALPHVAPEHLLIALMQEPSGVAGVAMRNVGIDIRRLSAEALRNRFQQMRTIERIVRAVKASVKYKRKTREEMLAHLTAIYVEELEAGHSQIEAQEIAAQRFGDPSELSRELQTSLPASEKIAWLFEYWLAWRPGESVVRMMSRTSLLSFVIILLIALMLTPNLRDVLRSMSVVLLVPATQFALGLCYYRIRDCMWGVFGTRRSQWKAALYSLLAALVMLAASAGLVPFMRFSLADWNASLPLFAIVSVLTPAAFLLQARFRGPAEIRDTFWATLDLEATC